MKKRELDILGKIMVLPTMIGGWILLSIQDYFHRNSVKKLKRKKLTEEDVHLLLSHT